VGGEPDSSSHVPEAEARLWEAGLMISA